MPKDRIPHKENLGITVVAKPVTKVLIFLAAAFVMLGVLLAANSMMAGV